MTIDHILIGAGRSGTTSLVSYLSQHPDIQFSSIKEVLYFSFSDKYAHGDSYLDQYFRSRPGVKATSDTYLLTHTEAPRRVYRHNPKIKIAAILRKPCKRTFSAYHYAIRQGYISDAIPFLDSQKMEQDVILQNDTISLTNKANFYGSLYHKHLSHWLEYFPQEQLFICTTEELSNSPKDVMDKYFSFLGLNAFPITKINAQNKSVTSRSKMLSQFFSNRDHWLRRKIRKPLQVNLIKKILIKSKIIETIKSLNYKEEKYRDLTQEEIAFCQQYFAHDVRKLKAQFGIHWEA